MTHGSLFSGVGGFDLAAEWIGWENKFHCEWNEFGKRVLNYYWPKAECYGDITKTDFTIWRGRIDILTGGFPCQPYSQAGKRLGKEDERHLWPEMLRAIREIQPRWVVGENVRGLTNWNGGLVFDEVQSDLEDLGYEITPFLLPACSVNAPHRRDRIWFIAYYTCNGHTPQREIGSIEGNRSEKNDEPKERKQQTERINRSHGFLRTTANPGDEQLQRSEFNRSVGSQREVKANSGQFSRPICGQWEKFPTQPPVCNGDDEFSGRLDNITFSKWRTESIKAGGNAVVPELVYQIFKAINKYENNNRTLI